MTISPRLGLLTHLVWAVGSFILAGMFLWVAVENMAVIWGPIAGAFAAFLGILGGMALTDVSAKLGGRQ